MTCTRPFIAAPVTVNKERAENLLFSEGYLNTDFQFVVKKDTPDIAKLEEFIVCHLLPSPIDFASTRQAAISYDNRRPHGSQGAFRRDFECCIFLGYR